PVPLVAIDGIRGENLGHRQSSSRRSVEDLSVFVSVMKVTITYKIDLCQSSGDNLVATIDVASGGSMPGSDTTRTDRHYAAPALEKGLDILELLSAEGDGLTQHQIAQSLGRSASEIFRMLSVLERRGYLLRAADGVYRLSLRMFELAHRHPPIRRLLTVAMP